MNWYRREKEKEEREEDSDWEESKRKEESWKLWRNSKKRKKEIRGKGKKKKEWKEEDIWGEKTEDNENYLPSPNGEDVKFQTVIFIQHTKHSRLASRIREKLSELEKIGKIKVKIVERNGVKLVDLLHKSNIWGEENCMREDCWNCSEENVGGKMGACYKKNIVYETYCITCQENEEKEEKEKREKEKKEREEEEESRKNGAVPSSDGDKVYEMIDSRNVKVEIEKGDIENKMEKKKEYKVKYVGESSRSLYERLCEHREDFDRLLEKSHKLKHYILAHRDIPREKMKFGIRIRKQYKKAFERQIGEAISIEKETEKGTILLNSKSEFNRCSVPRLIMGTYKDNLEEIKKEEDEKKKIKEEVRKLKKRKDEDKGDLLEVCKEIYKENYLPWKRRKIREESKWEEIERIEKQNWQRTVRMNKAHEKKKELMKRLERKKKEGKPLEWVNRKKENWRKYRVMNDIDDIDEDEMEEIRRKIILEIPERVAIEESELSSATDVKDDTENASEIIGNVTMNIDVEMVKNCDFMKKVIKYKNTKNVENSSENSFENSENSENVENGTENVENNL